MRDLETERDLHRLILAILGVGGNFLLSSFVKRLMALYEERSSLLFLLTLRRRRFDLALALALPLLDPALLFRFLRTDELFRDLYFPSNETLRLKSGLVSSELLDGRPNSRLRLSFLDRCLRLLAASEPGRSISCLRRWNSADELLPVRGACALPRLRRWKTLSGLALFSVPVTLEWLRGLSLIYTLWLRKLSTKCGTY